MVRGIYSIIVDLRAAFHVAENVILYVVVTVSVEKIAK